MTSQSYSRDLNYEDYLRLRKSATNQKSIVEYMNIGFSLTQKQIEVLKLVALGFSNVKIAQILDAKEATIKLLIYRLTKRLETILGEKVDRFYLVIIAQKLNFKEFD